MMMRRTGVGLVGAAALLTVWAAGPVADEPSGSPTAEVLVGDVGFVVVPLLDEEETRIGVAVDTSSGGVATSDVVYRFQMTGRLEELTGFESDVRVEFAPGELHLTRLGESAPFLYLTLDAPRDVREGSSTLEYSGFGLGRASNAGPWSFGDGSFAPGFYSWLLYVCNTAECDAGGPGSTSCSIEGCWSYPTGCEVTCGNPYYACCNCLIGGANCVCTVD